MMSVSGLFGGQQTAGYPNTDYPSYDFFGPTPLQPKGGTAETNHNVTPQQRKHMILVIVGVAVLGYLAFHLNYVK